MSIVMEKMLQIHNGFEQNVNGIFISDVIKCDSILRLCMYYAHCTQPQCIQTSRKTPKK